MNRSWLRFCCRTFFHFFILFWTHNLFFQRLTVMHISLFDSPSDAVIKSFFSDSYLLLKYLRIQKLNNIMLSIQNSQHFGFLPWWVLFIILFEFRIFILSLFQKYIWDIFDLQNYTSLYIYIMGHRILKKVSNAAFAHAPVCSKTQARMQESAIISKLDMDIIDFFESISMTFISVVSWPTTAICGTSFIGHGWINRGLVTGSVTPIRNGKREKKKKK